MFWRRRFLLLAVVLAIVWGATTAWPHLGFGEEPAPPVVQPAPSESPTPEPAPTVGAQESVQLTIDAGSEPCDPEQVRITPVVPPDQRVGGAVAVDLLVSTAGEQACTLTPGDADVVAVVSQGETAVWDSSVCSADMFERTISLSPQWSTMVQSGWSGKGSGFNCSDDEGAVSPGRYTLQIGTLGGEPGEVAFELAEKKPEPKKSEEPETSEGNEESDGADPEQQDDQQDQDSEDA